MTSKCLSSINSRMWDLRHSIKQSLSLPGKFLNNHIYRSIYSRVLEQEKAATVISNLVGRDVPFMISRLGSVESRLCYEYAFKSSRYSRTTFKQSHNNAGIFPSTSQQLDMVAEAYISSFSNIDVLGFWSSPGQHELVSRFCNDTTLVDLLDLEPWRTLSVKTPPWSRLLAGKSVLVVHPFVESIARQFHSRSFIFPETQILPSFRLSRLCPPVTHCGLTDGYESWSHAFRSLEDAVLSRSFDVALIGCGSYGLPLASSIKNSNRQAIHLGGSLQLLFGILGRRWENDDTISRLVNDHWTRPLPSERPIGSSGIDGGSYW